MEELKLNSFKGDVKVTNLSVDLTARKFKCHLSLRKEGNMRYGKAEMYAGKISQDVITFLTKKRERYLLDSNGHIKKPVQFIGYESDIRKFCRVNNIDHKDKTVMDLLETLTFESDNHSPNLWKNPFKIVIDESDRDHCMLKLVYEFPQRRDVYEHPVTGEDVVKYETHYTWNNGVRRKTTYKPQQYYRLKSYSSARNGVTV